MQHVMKALACIALVVTLLGASASAAEVEAIQDDDLALGSATPSSTKAAFVAWYQQIKPAEADRHRPTFFEWYNSVKTSGFSEFNDGLNHRYLSKLQGKFTKKKKKTKKRTKKKKKTKAKTKASQSARAHRAMIAERLLPPAAAAVPSSQIPFQEDTTHLIPKRAGPPQMANPARHPLLQAAAGDEEDDDEETQFVLTSSNENPETRRLKRRLSRMEESVEADEEEDDSEALGDYYGDLHPKASGHPKHASHALHHPKHVEEIEASGKENDTLKKRSKPALGGHALDLMGEEIAAIGAQASAEEDLEDDANLNLPQDDHPPHEDTTTKAARGAHTKPESVLVQAPFFRTLFRGRRQRLSNYDPLPKKRHVAKLRRDRIESNNELSSAATVVAYSDAKRLIEGDQPTRYLNRVHGHRSHYAAEYSRRNDDAQGIINPGFRHGPRNHEMDTETGRFKKTSRLRNFFRL